MLKTAKKVSLTTKNNILSQMLAIAKTSKLYLEDKFALKKLLAVIKKQRKRLKVAHLLLDADDKAELLVGFSTVIRLVSHLIKDDTTLFVQNTNALDKWIEDIEKQISDVQSEMSDSTMATDSVNNINMEDNNTAIKDITYEESADMKSKKINQEVSK